MILKGKKAVWKDVLFWVIVALIVLVGSLLIISKWRGDTFNIIAYLKKLLRYKTFG